MSNFITKIPVDVEGVKRQLPPGSDFEKVVWNEQNKVIEFHWSNRDLKHPYTVWEYPWHDVQEKKLPACVTVRERPAVVASSAPVVAPAKPVDTKHRRGVRRVQ